MKKFILLFALVAFTFSSCEKDLYDEEIAKNQTIKDLVISPDFDWNMTQTVTVTLTATAETAVGVYVNAACTNEYKVIECTVMPGMMPIEVEVPAAISTLYVKYDGAVKSFSIVNQKAEYTFPTTAKSTRGWGNGNNEVPMYVGKSWSTLMFEDLFPKLGDYDFNDFVANYKYNLVYVVSSNNQGKVTSSHVVGYEYEFRVNAIGANYTITPYLKVTTKHKSLAGVFNYDPQSKKNELIVTSPNPNIKIELVATGSDYQVFKFVGMTDKDPRIFLNTEEGVTLEAPTTIKVEAHTVDNQGIKWENAYTADVLEFDFFIYNGYNEVHKRGFAPALGATYPAADVEFGAGDEYYSNSGNLIWAIDVPAVINHAIEKKNFLNAYPKFKAWATSKGEQNKDWYNSPDSKYIIDYMGKHPL